MKIYQILKTVSDVQVVHHSEDIRNINLSILEIL